MVSDVEVATDRTLVGAMSWSDAVDIDFRLDDYVTRAEVVTSLDYIRYAGGLTNTAAALSVLRTQMFWTASRPGALLPGAPQRRHTAHSCPWVGLTHGLGWVTRNGPMDNSDTAARRHCPTNSRTSDQLSYD